MGDNMNNFVAKLETEKYLIGSFDVFMNNSLELVKTNLNKTDEEANEFLKTIPTATRAAITTKDGEYVGFIGITNVDAKNDAASIVFEVNREVDKEEILTEFKKYLSDSLNIKYTDGREFSESNIIMPSKSLIPNVTAEDLEKFGNPNLKYPFTIKSHDKTIGIIGLSNLLWANKRASLQLFLDESLGSDIVNELSGYIIDEYINYVHSVGLHNITFSVSGSNKDMLDVVNQTNMNYYGSIPYGASTGDKVESSMMFQHVPYMEKNGVLIPENKSVSIQTLDTEKKELRNKIELDNGFAMINPSSFEEEGINFDKVLEGHIKAMQNRTNFTIPLGEDKYFLQVGNENYGLYKALKNSTYVILDSFNNYAGYINILRKNADGKNVEIEIAIDPTLQNRGLGTAVINNFYDELFSTGVASITSSVFSFNNPSMKLHEKVASLNGTRIESYYINGKLWDMNVYSKVNEELGKTK